jgi:hypothetical protein
MTKMVLVESFESVSPTGRPGALYTHARTHVDLMMRGY